MATTPRERARSRNDRARFHGLEVNVFIGFGVCDERGRSYALVMREYTSKDEQLLDQVATVGQLQEESLILLLPRVERARADLDDFTRQGWTIATEDLG